MMKGSIYSTLLNRGQPQKQTVLPQGSLSKVGWNCDQSCLQPQQAITVWIAEKRQQHSKRTQLSAVNSDLNPENKKRKEKDYKCKNIEACDRMLYEDKEVSGSDC